LEGDKIKILTVPDIVIHNEYDSTGTGPGTADHARKRKNQTVVSPKTLKMPTIGTAEAKRRFITEEQRLFPESTANEISHRR
jgi:hypothetical protein